MQQRFNYCGYLAQILHYLDIVRKQGDSILSTSSQGSWHSKWWRGDRIQQKADHVTLISPGPDAILRQSKSHTVVGELSTLRRGDNFGRIYNKTDSGF